MTEIEEYINNKEDILYDKANIRKSLVSDELERGRILGVMESLQDLRNTFLVKKETEEGVVDSSDDEIERIINNGKKRIRTKSRISNSE